MLLRLFFVRRFPAPAVVSGLTGVLVLSMLATASAAGQAARSRVNHLDGSVSAPGPFDPLSTAEVARTMKVVEASEQFATGSVFPLVELKEPLKAEVLAGQSVSRQAFAIVYDPSANSTSEAVVDLASKRIVSWTPKSGVQPALTATDFVDADALVRADSRWTDAMHARGLNPDDIYLDGWAPGEPLPSGVNGTDRLMRELSFFKGKLPNPYDRPIEGVVVTVDLTTRQVVDFIDGGVEPVDTTSSGSATSPRTGLRPLVVQQPRGPSFHLDGNAVTWQGWHFQVGWTPREGLVLYQIGYSDHGKVRPIIHRLSLSEIYVPYGIPDPNWAWRAALDVGEYNLGQYSEALAKNVDVPENAVFFDAASQYNSGSANVAFPLPHAIAMYERDAGVLWDRTDPTTLERDPRFARELVVTNTMPIGNYSYAFDYIFWMDGGIDVEVHATGTTLNQGVTSADAGDANGTMVTSNIAAPNHQHFFNFRIDFDVDGAQNRLLEQSVHGAPSSTGNAFVAETSIVGAEGARDGATNRSWIVQSSTEHNALDRPTGYSLLPGEEAAPLSDASFPMLQHAQFATHQLWVTRYADGQLYAAGDYPNQAGPGDGLPKYIAEHRNIQDQDLVVWYTAGFTHIPVVEEYPVMTTDTTSFSIRPNGFFDSNPALDAP